LVRAIAALPAKDQRRLDDTFARLHAANGRLWDAEDRVRAQHLTVVQVADCKREIDQFNSERNALAERADEVLGSLAGAGGTDAPLHTETIASVVDHLSVLTLRIWHSEQAVAHDELMRRRIPALQQQREELCVALDTLVADVVAGHRRLPAPARFKIYGRDEPSSAEVAALRTAISRLGNNINQIAFVYNAGGQPRPGELDHALVTLTSILARVDDAADTLVKKRL
jgi:hypothetical protein